MRSSLIICTAAYIVVFALALAQSLAIHSQRAQQLSANDYLNRNSKEYLVKHPENKHSFAQDYVILKLRQNTFKAFEKLTENWIEVPNRSARQTVEREAAIGAVGASLNIAHDVIRSVVAIIGTVFGPSLVNPRVGSTNGRRNSAPGDDLIQSPTKSQKADKEERKMQTKIPEYDILTFAETLRDKSYSDQLTGALSILVQVGEQDTPSLKNEDIKSTVDYTLDMYSLTHGKPEALFLPQIFKGIPRKT